MRFAKLGGTGIDVSVICLGCMGLADPALGYHPWAIGWEGSREIIRQALAAEVNFFDTANVYSRGSSEEYLGRALSELGADRDQLVIATKVNGRMREGANGAGLSRKAILTEIDHSLERLGMDYVDLYQVHRWDYETPVEETLEALNDVVRAGKARYIGASSMWAWQLAKALRIQGEHGWARYVSMQDHYNLLYREEEREVLPLCADEGLATIPWSPLARGRLARPWDEETARSESRRVRQPPLPRRGPRDRRADAERGGAARRQAGPGRARLAALEAGGDGADRRGDEARAPRRRGRRGRPRALGRGRRDPRGDLPAAPGRRPRLRRLDG